MAENSWLQKRLKNFRLQHIPSHKLYYALGHQQRKYGSNIIDYGTNWVQTTRTIHQYIRFRQSWIITNILWILIAETHTISWPNSCVIAVKIPDTYYSLISWAYFVRSKPYNSFNACRFQYVMRRSWIIDGRVLNVYLFEKNTPSANWWNT